jgi:hypothetical protein
MFAMRMERVENGCIDTVSKNDRSCLDFPYNCTIKSIVSRLDFPYNCTINKINRVPSRFWEPLRAALMPVSSGV